MRPAGQKIGMWSLHKKKSMSLLPFPFSSKKDAWAKKFSDNHRSLPFSAQSTHWEKPVMRADSSRNMLFLKSFCVLFLPIIFFTNAFLRILPIGLFSAGMDFSSRQIIRIACTISKIMNPSGMKPKIIFARTSARRKIAFPCI